MCVNISYRQRESLLNFSRFWLGRSTSDGSSPHVVQSQLAGLEKYVVTMKMFDGVIRELLRLMENAFYRFQITDEYSNLLDEFNSRLATTGSSSKHGGASRASASGSGTGRISHVIRNSIENMQTFLSLGGTASM